MRRKKEDTGLKAFNNAAARKGITYAEAQRRETAAQMKRIRAPRTDGRQVYMTVEARNKLRKLVEADHIEPYGRKPGKEDK